MSSMLRCKGHRRPLLASCASTLVAMNRPAEAEEADYVYPEWIRLPLAPYARRRTLLKELVPNQVWTLDQVFGTFYVYVPIRATVLKVKGGLLVYAPVAATKECLGMVKELEAKHGPVRWILLPSKAVEHKVLAGPFAKKFPDAKFYVAPGQFSVPLDLPLSVLGFPDFEVLDPERLKDLPWNEDCLTAYVDAATFGEVALLHKSSQTLVVTDSLISIPEDPPELLMDAQYSKALAYHARDDATSVLQDSPETRRKGWARIALFTTFFNPGGLADGEVRIPEASATRPWQWQANWQQSFQRLRQNGKAFVAPIIRELILKQQPEKTLAYVERIASWNFQRAVSAHFDPIRNFSPKQFRECFAFLKRPTELPYCAEDVKFLVELQQSAIPNGEAVKVGQSCGFQPRA